MMKTTTMLALCAMIGSAAFATAQEKPERPQRPERPDRPHRQGMRPPPEAVKEFDKDGDGKLSPEEAKAFREARRKEMLEKYDADGDGKLNADERRKISEERRAEMIKRYDKDGDGKLSDEERKAMPRFQRGPGAPERHARPHPDREAPAGDADGKEKAVE